MTRTAARYLRIFFAVGALLAPGANFAQRQRQLPAPDETAYGSKFFDQLHNIFGVFRNSDLQHAFELARPIQCSELVVSKGEWRTVAFFNEDRSLGEWCRESLEEVKADLSVYTFKGVCSGDQDAIQVTTEFPVGASVDLYNAGKVPLDQVDVNVNAPVTAVFDASARSYVFELPYLFLTGKRSSGNIYSLIAPRVEDSYATDVSSRWECKAVKSDDVTYRFLICRTATVPRNRAVRNRSREASFGSSAYFILSDGMEAQSSVHLSFGSQDKKEESTAVAASPASSPARPVLTRTGAIKGSGSWQAPDVRSKVLDLAKGEVRLRFSAQTWTGKIGTSQVLADQKLSAPQAAKVQEGADYCTWHPATLDLVSRLLATEPDVDILYAVEGFAKNSLTPASIVFNVKTRAGARLGALQCFFPRAESASTIDFSRWVSIVGGHLMLETRR